jgi:2-haloalkanoic acid dehalogenase type II
MATYDIVTFDCYGTLIDWEEGIGTAFEHAAGLARREAHRATVVADYAEFEPQIQAERYRPYREVLALTAERVARRLGWSGEEGSGRFLPESLGSWRPFPDTNEALERISKSGLDLGILSNVDDDLLEQTRRHLPVEFSCIVTAAQVGSYKPAEGHFREARRRIGGRRWLHAAQSYFHDVVPARRLGIAVAWVNRKGEKPSGEARPDYEVPDLAALADLLAGG